MNIYLSIEIDKELVLFNAKKRNIKNLTHEIKVYKESSFCFQHTKLTHRIFIHLLHFLIYSTFLSFMHRSSWPISMVVEKFIRYNSSIQIENTLLCLSEYLGGWRRWRCVVYVLLNYILSCTRIIMNEIWANSH